MNGIDLYHGDAAAASKVSYDFLIAKASQGTGFNDPAFASTIKTALKRGKRVGFYHFANGQDPAAEAAAFAKATKAYWGDGIAFLDFEAGALTKWSAKDVKKFCDTFKAKTGCFCGVYASRSTIDSKGLKGSWGLWNAAYPNDKATGYYKPTRQRGEMIRQYTASGKLSGYSGKLDLDYSWWTAAEWDVLAKGGAPKPGKDYGDDAIGTSDLNYIWALFGYKGSKYTYIGGQSKAQKNRLGGFKASAVHYGSGGSRLVKAIQSALNRQLKLKGKDKLKVDGIVGEKTIKCDQRALNAMGAKLTVDGITGPKWADAVENLRVKPGRWS